MAQDATKVLLGTAQMSGVEILNEDADPATFEAGLALRRSSSAISVSTGSLIGVSFGRSLSDTKRTAVARTGLRVPLQLTDIGVRALLKVGDITFTAKNKGVAGNSVTIAFVDTGLVSPAVVVTVNAIVVNMDGGVTTALAIKNAVEASAPAMALLSTVVVDPGDDSAAQSAASAAPLATGVDSYAYAVIGAAVRVTTTGKAINTSGTLTGANYCTNQMWGIDAVTGELKPVALIDMQGGL